MRNIVYTIGYNGTGGVSQHFLVQQRAWQQVLIQQGKRPIDAEINLLQQAILEQQRLLLKTLLGSGVATAWTIGASVAANSVRLHDGPGLLGIVVDGRLTQAGDPDNANRLTVALSAAPGSGTRQDGVWLEVWYEEVQPPVSTQAASESVYKLGGVSNATLTNDLEINSLEQARRVQARWRLRVADGIDRVTHPNILSLSTLRAQGGAATPTASLGFTNDTGDLMLWTAGAGTIGDAQDLKSVDGYVYAIPLAWIERNADELGTPLIPTSRVTKICKQIAIVNADTVDGIHASTTPTANQLLALNGSAQYPIAVIPFTNLNADTVDGFHAYPSTSPTANALLALDPLGQFPNSALKTGSGNGLDGDKVDSFHASPTPIANMIPVLDGSGKLPISVIPAGHTTNNTGVNADTVDGAHASLTPAPNMIPVLDGFGKLALAAIPFTGLNADQVDGAHAFATATANAIPVLNGSAKLDVSMVPYTGLNADMLDGQHKEYFALAGHTHSFIELLGATNQGMTAVATVNGSWIVAYTQSMVFTTSGDKLLTWSIDVATSANNVRWESALFIDGVQQSFVIQEVGNPSNSNAPNSTNTRQGFGVYNITAGTHVITVRLRHLTAGTGVTATATRVSLIAVGTVVGG